MRQVHGLEQEQAVQRDYGLEQEQAVQQVQNLQ